MSSSFPKHFCLHRFVAFFSALSMAGSFVVLTRKDCHEVLLARENAQWLDPTQVKVQQNETLKKLAEEDFVIHYYDYLQISHAVISAIGVIFLALSFINIAPAQEDLRFGFHLLVIIIMGSVTLLSFYSSYVAFYRPCRADNGDGIYHIETRMPKDKKPVNAYVENDEKMMIVTGLDAVCGLLLLIATMILGFDAREEAIRDEYVARVSGHIY